VGIVSDSADSAHPDVVGFGALNVDYIASASRLSQRTAERVTESTARFDWNLEGPVDEATITGAIGRLGAASLSYSLGGSAWLTTFALAQMRVGLRLGYVGVVGRVEAPGLSFLGQMDELGVDRRWVGRRPDRVCGLCLSYIDDTDRVMLTHPGANFEMCDHIRRNFDEIAGYLASARYIHLTSFLDDETPAEALRVLARAKELNPALRLSFDPGFDWAEHPGPAVEGILGRSDLVFSNYREFKALGRYAHGESDDAVARKVLARCAPGCSLYVTKRYDLIEVFRDLPHGVVAHRFQLERPINETELEDATGAGDVFSAAVLASLTSNRLKVELGAFLGLSLARYKMRQGPRVPRPPGWDLSKGFLQQSENFADFNEKPNGVLIVHGGDRQWIQVRDFVEEGCGLVAQELDSRDVEDGNLADVMSAQLGRCSFAVCLLDEHAGPESVHQAGIFQGRYGFGRVALMAERGYSGFSNVAGLIRLDFPHGHIDTTFFELERMLRREGLLRPGEE
jgi:sugar/nucleoside kinase (ribokinase family)